MLITLIYLLCRNWVWISNFWKKKISVHADADDVQNGSNDDNVDVNNSNFGEGTSYRQVSYTEKSVRAKV